MKHINFIKPVTPQAFASARFWYRLSVIVIGVELIGMIAIQLQSRSHLRALKQTKQQLIAKKDRIDAVAHQHAQLAQEKRQLDDQLKTVTTIKNRHLQKHAQLASIRAALAKTHMQLISLTLNATRADLSAYCRDAHAASELMQALSHTPQFRATKLVRLQPSKKIAQPGYIAHITAHLNQS